ncbi:MAG: hypothetical protein LBV52_02885 [Spirochaetaceae bacterium]|jgi:hypothetical protein|nr:hypothetical protein [Spirochaetaceae bacterium]
MMDRVLIDTLNFKSTILGMRWKDEVRKNTQLIHYNSLNDDLLTRIGAGIFPELANFVEHGLNRSVLGSYFVKMGKGSVHRGYPISETVYGLRIGQQIILEYMESEFVLDNPVALYQTISIIPRVADFFLLGCFYVNKGFQEATFANMSAHDGVSEKLLRKYFKDDFFFKTEDED